MERLILNKDNCRIVKVDMYLVRLELSDGTVLDELEPRRLFPHTDLDRYVTLLDLSENEVALIKDINEVDKESRQALLECFNNFYMIPKISEILYVQDKFGTLKINAATDRGNVEFRIRNRHSDIKMLSKSGRVLIRDSDDNRYEIPRYDDLDRHSKHLLFSYV